MSLENQYSLKYNRLFESVSNFVANKYNVKKLKYLLDEGLKVYLDLPDMISVSLYLLNKETFTFDLARTYPDHEDASVFFDALLENQSVGNALRLGSPVVTTLDNVISNFALLPLVCFDGINGLVILRSDDKQIFSELAILNLLNFYSSLYGISINEMVVSERETQNKEVMDQVVASRTLDLQHKQMQMGDKFSSLTSSLTMVLPHEVRTPINQIRGLADYLKNHILDKDADINEVAEILTDIHESANRLNHLFENYLYYSNLIILSSDINQINLLQKQYTQSAETYIFEIVMGKANNYDRQNDVVLHLVEATVAIGETFLMKVIEELSDNCFKYSLQNTKVIVSSYFKDNKLIISFKDFGIGMTDEQTSNIDAYMQFDRNTNEQQGSGLGLAIVTKILSLHRGELSINSVKDAFTETIITVPLMNEGINDLLNM